MEQKNHYYPLILSVLTVGLTVFLIGKPQASVLAFGSESAQITSASSFALPNTAPWTTIGANTQPMRWEMRVHNFGTDFPAYPSALVGLGPVYLAEGTISGMIRASSGYINGLDAIYNNGPAATFSAGVTDILIRVQRDVVNSRYTIEVCSATSGVCTSGAQAILSYSPSSWAGQTISLYPGGDFAFIRWFSSVVPVGTPIPITGVTGDLGDWEFEGNLNDSSGQGNNFTGGTASYSATPIYTPSCNAGTQQSFRVGSTGQLDGSGSQPLDGGTTLSYQWTQTTGPTVNFSDATAAKPTITGMNAFGSYNFHLTVTDSSNQSSSCDVHDGAVVTDAHGVVVTGSPALDTLLGPLVHYGENPWPWFDNRNKQAADNQISVMDSYFPAWWDTPAPGTVTATTGSNIIVGVGTTFTTTFCGGQGNTTPSHAYTMIAIWHPLGSGTGREQKQVVSCTDDTHLVMADAYADNNTAQFPGNTYFSLSGSGLNYSADVSGAALRWGWGNGSASPANYYDNVAAYYSLYYRTGFDEYLTAARKLADRWWTSPMIDQGMLAGGYVFAEFRQMALLGMVLRAEDNPPANMWPGLELFWNAVRWYLNIWDPQDGIYDTREIAYQLEFESYCALYDPNPTVSSNCQKAIINSFPAVWTPTKFPDGSWPQLYHDGGSWGSGGVNLTNGSTVVTAIGTPNWTSGQFPTRIWFLNSTSTWPADNSAGDPVSYTVTFANSTQLTLGSPYQGTTGAHGWELDTTDGPISGWASEPFMTGILAEGFDLAAKAMEAVSPPTASSTATAILAHSYNVAAANWLKNYGFRPATKGLYYYVDGIECQPPISESSGICTSGMPADTSRALLPEGMRGPNSAYVYNQDPSLLTYNVTAFNAMWAKPGTCPAGSTACVPDGSYIDMLEDWEYMMNTPDVSLLGNAAPWKWFGMFFGVSDEENVAASYLESTSVSNPPSITSVASSGITQTGATITWTTDESADSQVEYGTNTSYGSSSTLNSTQVTSHSVNLSGLSASTLYHFRVDSRNANGNLSVSSDNTFTTQANSSDLTPPTVSLTSPLNNTVVSSSISVQATATDNVGVTKVEFYLDNALQQTDTVSPYAWSWNTTGVSNGSHTLSAKAYDAARNIGISQSVTVIVSNNGTPIPGDINLDHIVNSLDYSIMNSHWFQNYAPADLATDGIVNSLDFAVLKSNWGKTW